MDLPDTTSTPVVRALVSTALPDISPRGLKFLRSADGIDTWTTADAVVVFPTAEEAAARLLTERALHGALRAKLGELVPEIVAASDPSDAFPFPANAYRKPRGRLGQAPEGPIIRPKPWARASLAKDLGAALVALHSIPVRTARSAGVRPVEVLDEHWLDADEAAIDRARAVAGDGVDAFLGAPLPTEARTAGKPVVCHTRLTGEHLFVSEDGTRLTAIVDWIHLAIAEPAVDLGGLTVWLGPSFVRQVAAESGAAPGTAERGVYLGRADLLARLDAAGTTGVDRVLLDAQLRAAFGPEEPVRRRR
ncbi:MAG TPA: phosphotransferase [Actinomycetota bacterium]